MKRLCLFLLLFCGLAFSQDSKNGTITTSGSDCTTAAACVSLPLASTSGAVGLSLSGTFTGTAQFEVSADNGATWVSASGTPPGSTTTATSATAAGTWRFAVSGLTNFRVRASALSAGSITVTIQSSQTSASLGGSGGGFTPPVTAPTFSGAQSIFLFNEGSGTTLTDSVSGNNCTLGIPGGAGAPTWVSSAGSLQFADNGIICPSAAFVGAKRITFWFGNTPSQSLLNNSQIDTLLSTDTGYVIASPVVTQGSYGYGAFGGFFNLSTVDRLIGDSSLSVSLGATPALYVNGHPPVAYANNTGDTTSLTATTNVYLGNYQTFSGYGHYGPLHAIVVYSTQPTQAQEGRDEAVMRSYLSGQRGILFQDYNAPLRPAVIWGGDSIPNSFGATPRNTYPVKAHQILGEGEFEYLNQSWPGQSANILSTKVSTNTVPIIKQFGSGNSVYHFAAGTNDINSSSTPAATILGYYNTICTAIHAAGGKCVIATVLPRSGNSGAQETIRTTLNASVISGWLAGTSPNADAVDDLGGDPIMGLTTTDTNGTYYNGDGTHPTDVGHGLLASRAACSVLLATGKANQPCWFTISVDFISLNPTAATTKTLNLLQLGPKWKVCGVTNNVTTAFTGGAISAMTVTIGDSLGTATTYMGSQSIFTATYKDGGYPTAPAVGAGIVQGFFTSTTANLSALTAGRMNVNICVVNQN